MCFTETKTTLLLFLQHRFQIGRRGVVAKREQGNYVENYVVWPKLQNTAGSFAD